MSNVVIDVNEKKLEGLANELNGVYNKLSGIKNSLESLHAGMRENWSDTAVDEFTSKFSEGMERVWDLLIAVDSMECFFTEAATGYMMADREVESL